VRRILLALMTTVAAVVTMFGYRTSTPHPAVTTTTTSIATGSTGATTPTTPTTTASGGSRTVTGAAVQTRWGVVQVQITVSGGKLTAVQAVQVPSDNPRDVQINSYAVPVLTQEALQAQSAHIDSVSGASVTSGGYISSLQSALDAAGL
jgi:uncharacterized protein with FMN-binding domain